MGGRRWHSRRWYPVGRDITERRVEEPRRDGLVALPEDLEVNVRGADRSLPTARGIEDLIAWSGDPHDPPVHLYDTPASLTDVWSGDL
ncbi:malonate decarboxylase subunit alpha [Streptosporangium vulgare]|uniref:Malonate decarboxylase subunit alpha n=1 Tax=Streptosporangium vulgare TaxID=46190 RepID=A0ABV5TLB2_9ACTN